MLVTHALATLGAACAWAVCCALWSQLRRWLGLAMVRLPRPTPVRRTPATATPPALRSCERAFSWTRRAPPRAA
ncbi:hypothetical protein [Ornithinimicrobium panacihumi]|uniref:hypothetical protein n=1 Tax=Ornithinimicrobium panacihumi TaxID=2008449 RepID=UPI003F8CA228